MRYFALLLCFIALAAAQTNPCETASYANDATNAITDVGQYDGATDLAGVKTRILALFNVANAISSGAVQNIYIGRGSSSDFYMIKNCKNQEGANVFCSQDGTSQWLGYARSQTVFGDAKRHVFPINAATPSVGDTLGAETADYATTGRTWYTTQGWTSSAYASGGSGYTLSKSVTGGVVAADRISREYCGQCYANSYAVATSEQIAAADLRSYRAITGANTGSTFNGVAKVILDVLLAVNSSSAVNAFVGFANDDSYLVKVCGAAANSGVTQCSNNRFLLYVSNNAVHGNQGRAVYALSAAGVVGDKLTTLADYRPTTTSWYPVGNGWSAPYTFASGSGTGATYAQAINGGVVGTDRVDTEPCNRSPTTVQTQCPNTNSAATSALGCGVALAAAAAAYAL